MSDYFNEREQKLMTGTPEGVPLLAPLSLAGLARSASESSPPPPEPETEEPIEQPDEPASAGLPATDFSTIVGISKHTLYNWKRRFEQEGPAGLMDRPRGGRTASPTTVARVLKETGYELEEAPIRPHPDKVWRFERGKPNQLWQTEPLTASTPTSSRSTTWRPTVNSPGSRCPTWAPTRPPPY
jgi:transposase-like protein